MSSKRKTVYTNEYRYRNVDIPDKLDKMNFFGIQCDEDQQRVVDAVWKRDKKLYMINSVAGSGKTLIATALGVLMFKYGIFDRVVYVTFPGIYEKSQGFLPGDLLEKSEPYFQPLYDALIRIGELPDHVCNTSAKAVDNGTDFIECTVSTYMRGINISKAFVIIDEAENADLETLAKVLSRISDDCITMLIGHAGQCDMYDKTKSGFTACIDFNNKHNPGFCESFELFTNHRGWVSQIADMMIDEYEAPCYGFIYMTKNLITGKLYIGQHRRTMNPEDIDDSWYLGSGVVMKLAIAKYGESNFERTILYECYDEIMLNYMEKYFISYYNAVDDEIFYNIARGGRGGNSHKAPDGIKERFEEYTIKSRKGIKRSEGTVERIRNNSKDRKSIFKDGVYKYVKIDTLDEYLQDGWVLKGSHTGMKYPYKTWVTNGVHEKNVRKEELEEYLSNGWREGRFIGTRRESIVKGGKRKRVFVEQLDYYKEQGWEVMYTRCSENTRGNSSWHLESRVLCKINALDDNGNIIKVYRTKEELKSDNLELGSIKRVCSGERDHYHGMRFSIDIVDISDRTSDGIRIDKKTLIRYGVLSEE